MMFNLELSIEMQVWWLCVSNHSVQPIMGGGASFISVGLLKKLKFVKIHRVEYFIVFWLFIAGQQMCRSYSIITTVTFKSSPEQFLCLFFFNYERYFSTNHVLLADVSVCSQGKYSGVPEEWFISQKSQPGVLRRSRICPMASSSESHHQELA